MGSIIDKILEYWFGNVKKPEEFPMKKLNLWFKNDDAVDREIKEKFGALLEKDLKEWD